MRDPDLDLDGWCLDDGEELHRQAPSTFLIPGKRQREDLQPGDYAKLVFRISVADLAGSVSVERMWVVVRECVPGGYLGVLDNDPDAIEENDEFWSGIELPFAPRHIVNIQPRTEDSVALAAKEPRRRWPQSEPRTPE
jgi:hypothetical protein